MPHRRRGDLTRHPATEGTPVVAYPAVLGVSHELTACVARLLYEHRRTRNTRRRRLDCFEQTLFGSARLRMICRGANRTADVVKTVSVLRLASAWSRRGSVHMVLLPAEEADEQGFKRSTVSSDEQSG